MQILCGKITILISFFWEFVWASDAKMQKNGASKFVEMSRNQ